MVSELAPSATLLAAVALAPAPSAIEPTALVADGRALADGDRAQRSGVGGGAVADGDRVDLAGIGLKAVGAQAGDLVAADRDALLGVERDAVGGDDAIVRRAYRVAIRVEHGDADRGAIRRSREQAGNVDPCRRDRAADAQQGEVGDDIDQGQRVVQHAVDRDDGAGDDRSYYVSDR